MVQKKFELNCDVGEGAGNDHLIMPYLDACSIACGGHSGDKSSMQETVAMALKSSVAIGAHPSFPDKKNFGRKIVNIERSALKKSLIEQVNSLEKICEENEAQLSHIKLHGALYNLAANDEEFALLTLGALAQYKQIPFYAPWNSQFQKVAMRLGFILKTEAFADRKYRNDLSLVGRDHADAVIVDPELAMDQVLLIIDKKNILTVDEKLVPIHAETICVHGDNPKALDILRSLNELQVSG